MPLDRETVRVDVYEGFAETGRPPSVEELAHRHGVPVEQVRAALHELAEARHVVLGPDDTVLMAHPFATIPLGFSVMGRRTLWWGGCAWDSFAVPHLVADAGDVLVATTCPGCGAALSWVVGRDAPPDGRQVAHFLVPVARIWDDVVHTCRNQRLYCDEGCVDVWLRTMGEPKGYVMDLPTLWRLAGRWYEGRLQHGYTRRDPVTAASYFADVGLRGPFWGL